MPLKVLVHVNHLWGVGHYTRIAAIANAVAAAGGDAVILAGNDPVAGRTAPAVRTIALEPLRAADPSYGRLVDRHGGEPTDAVWRHRWRQINQALGAASPDVVVTETFPFGRRKLSDELLHLCAAAKDRGAKLVCSLRDIPTPPRDARRLDECAARLRDYYDAVFLHGDPSVMEVATLWPGDIPASVRPTGYVVAETGIRSAARSGVIVSAGGGGDAAPLLQAAAALRSQGYLAGEAWTLVAGPNASDALIESLAGRAGIAVHRAVTDLPGRIATARLSISRGGYNTLIETVAAGTRAVIVPATPGGEAEQAIRARQFAARGLVVHLDETVLTPVTLRNACEAAMAGPPPDPTVININGAAHSAALLAEIAEAR